MTSTAVTTAEPELAAINTAEEVADFLRVETRVVNEMARDGRIAAFKPARSWRFTRQAVMDYIAEGEQTRQRKLRALEQEAQDDNPWGRRTRSAPRKRTA